MRTQHKHNFAMAPTFVQHSLTAIAGGGSKSASNMVHDWSIIDRRQSSLELQLSFL